MALAHWTNKSTKAAEVAVESDPKSVTSGENENKDDGNLESNQELGKDIAARIGRPLKSPLRN